MYNLRVAEYHTYFVGCDDWGFAVWAHNAKCTIVKSNGKYKVLDKRGNVLAETTSANKAAQYAFENNLRITGFAAKPTHAPEPGKWIEKGESIKVAKDGTWTYKDWNGNRVRYPGGNPDFEAAGMVKATARFPGEYKGNYTTDYTNANKYAKIQRDPATETWHHHEGLTKMQLIDAELHDRFTHLGGVSIISNR